MTSINGPTEAKIGEELTSGGAFSELWQNRLLEFVKRVINFFLLGRPFLKAELLITECIDH